MKKVLLVVLAGIISVLSGCSVWGVSATTIALTNMDKLESYRMDLTLKLDGESVLTSYALVQGGYEQLHIGDVQMDLFIEEDGTYVIERFNGIPVLQYSEEYSLDEENYDDFAFFLDAEFEQDGDYWVMTGEQDLFEDVTEIKFLLKNNRVKEMILVGEMEEMELEIFILFSEYNDVSIDIPPHITEEEYDAFLEDMASVGIQSIDLLYNGAFFLNGETIWVDCGESYDNVCFFESSPALFYNWVDNTYSDVEMTLETTFETYAELNAVYPNSGVTEELIAFIELYLEYLSME